VDMIDRIITVAADYLQAHGWCQQGYQDCEGRVCILGAIRHQTARCGHMFVKVVERIETKHGINIVSFNDDQCKSKKQALAFMRAAVESDLEQAPRRGAKQQQGRQ
jgi:hypothetical protein